MSERWQVIIVGSGPAGSATALALAQHDPDLARRTLILEKAVHPRVKLCGGGVTPLADQQLAALDVSLDIPEVPIQRATFHIHGYGLEIRATHAPLFRVVDRRLFDQALVRAAVERGATLREGERVREVEQLADGVRVTTDGGQVEGAILVAADGARSVVRQRLLSREPSRISRLMEVLTSERTDHPLIRDQHAVFDFSGLTRGLQGYTWNFPSVRDGRPVMNRGVFDSRIDGRGPRADLRATLDHFIQPEYRLDQLELQGHPERWYHPAATVHLPRVLFVGEAAGIEPFAGEGIGFALGYGRLAADEIVEAVERGRYDFDGYPRRLRRSEIGRTLRRRRLTAAFLYRFRSLTIWRLGFQLSVPIVRRIVPEGTEIVSIRPTH